jgi:hypothetical protein
MAGYIVKLSLKTIGDDEALDLGYLSFKDNRLQNTHTKEEAHVYPSIILAEGGVGNYLNGQVKIGWPKDNVNKIIYTIEPN